MPNSPIGIKTRSLRLPLKQALLAAAELGAEGVEIDLRNELRMSDFSQTALRQFRKLLDDLGLRVLAVSFPTKRGFDDPQDLERRVLATREAMSFAYKIGAHVVLGQAGEINPVDAATEDDEEQAETSSSLLADTLNLLAMHGDRVGARFAFISGADPADQLALLKSLPEGTLGVSLYPPLLIDGGYDTESAAALLGAQVLHLHAVDAVREPSGASEVELGRGVADLPAMLGRLEEHSYRGPITVERNTGSQISTDLANAIAYLRSL